MTLGVPVEENEVVQVATPVVVLTAAARQAVSDVPAKSTVPPSGGGETVAVKVTDCPTTKVFEVVVKAVVVEAGLTVSVKGKLDEGSSAGTAVLPL